VKSLLTISRVAKQLGRFTFQPFATRFGIVGDIVGDGGNAAV
jgi:hypothetical protein